MQQILHGTCLLVLIFASFSLHRTTVQMKTKSSHLFLHQVDEPTAVFEFPSFTSSTALLLPSLCRFFAASVMSLSLFSSVASPALALDALPPIPYALRMGEAPVAVNEPTKLSDGVEYFDIVLGNGEEAKEGRSVQFLWVLRRSNGYFVASSASDFANEPFIYRLGNRQKVIVGVDEAIRGMRVGGIRRVSIPPNAAFVGVDDTDPGPLPKEYGPRRQILTRKDREVWKMEIKLLKVK